MSRLRTIEKEIDPDDAIRYLELIAEDTRKSRDKQALVLCDVSMNQLTRVNDRSRLLKALRIAQGLEKGHAAINVLSNALEEEANSRPDDWSIPANTVVDRAGDERGSRAGIVRGTSPPFA